MINEFKKQTIDSLTQFLRMQVEDNLSYCKDMTGVIPFCGEKRLFLYSTGTETVILLLDHPEGDVSETVDEGVDGILAPYRSANGKVRCSPVRELRWVIAEYIHALREGNMSVPMVWGVMLTSSNLVNYDEMKAVWEKLGVTVFHNFNDIDHLDIIQSERCPKLITRQNYLFWLQYAIDEIMYL